MNPQDHQPWSAEFEAAGGTIDDRRSAFTHTAARSSPSRGGRQRWHVLVAVVAVSAAVAVVAIGLQLGDPSSPATSSSTPPSLASVSAERRTLVVPDALADSGAKLIVLERTGQQLQLLRVDLPSGTITRIGESVEEGDPVSLVANEDGTFLLAGSGQPSWWIGQDDAPTNLGQIDAGRLVGELGATFVWATPGDRSVVLLPLEVGKGGLSPMGSAAAIGTADVIGNDGTGGVVLRAGGSVFVRRLEGTEQVSDGDLLAISPSHLLARECRNELSCANVLIDRTSGNRGTIEHAELASPIGHRVGIGVLPTIGPSARTMFVETSAFQSGWALISQDGRAIHEVPGPDSNSPILWFGEELAVWVSDGELFRLTPSEAGPSVGQVEGLDELVGLAEAD